MRASARSRLEADYDAQLVALVMLAIETAADDVFARLIVVGLGIGELSEKRRCDPPLARRVRHRRADEVHDVGALGGGEATAFIAAVVAVFDAAVPAGRELVGESGGQFELAFAFPVAMETLLFRRCRQVRRPYHAIVEKILLQDELCLELALIEAPGGLDIKREADWILVRA